mmetsp:Transcript_14174/g.28020  ORF Transcript_14174/g.28020 Transcript_14174/m.28020 type:complete len:145 (-) Transcript_14174:117-551(-)
MSAEQTEREIKARAAKHKEEMTALRAKGAALHGAADAGVEDFWRHAAIQDWRSLNSAPPELRQDRELILELVQRSQGGALEFASDDLRSDPVFVREALDHSNGFALEYAATALQRDPAMMARSTSLKQQRASGAVARGRSHGRR